MLNTNRTITGDSTAIQQVRNIILLVLSILFMAGFIFWMSYEEARGKSAIVPNSLWKNKAFSCICINVFLVWGAFNAFEQYQNFFFQDLQGLSTLDAALHFIPAPISGALTNVVVGLIVHRFRGDWIIVLTTVPCAIASLLMAVAQPQWSYWTVAFLANFLNPIGADGMFTVSNLLITSMFPTKTQGVAGGVFNTVSQTGKSVGLALAALVAEQTKRNMLDAGRDDGPALLDGYHAAFWFCMAMVLTSSLVTCWGLRNIGKVGQKED
jgi:nitrate/nitrite transporter NarK